MCTIEVAPVASGWQVTLSPVSNGMLYRSGRAAETAAMSLAKRLARAGVPSQVKIYLRDGSMAADVAMPAFDLPSDRNRPSDQALAQAA
jgi:hypothetical protein